MHRLLSTLVVLAALTVLAPAAAASQFSPTGVWDAPLAAGAPRDSNSAALVASLGYQVATAGAWINTTQYSVPVYTVSATQPTVRVALDNAYAPLQEQFEAVPLGANSVPARGTDAHLVLRQPATDTLWEFWHLRKLADGWHAGWGGRMTSTSTNPGIFSAPFGATATSLPLLGGLMRFSELKAGHIDHALALAVPNEAAGSFVWPAQRTDGRSIDIDAIPAGTRFRLDPALDLGALDLPAVARMMARAAQRYGIVVRDYSAAVTFYAEDPTPTGTNPYPSLFGGQYPDKVLAKFPWDRLHVVKPPQ
jgi:hypothetical protein